MTDFLRFLVDIIQFIWPFRIVKEYEKGVRYTFGRYVDTVGPGCYFKVPFFMDLHEISIAPGMIGTHRQDITLLDGSSLSFKATAWHKVVDPALAINSVEDFETTSCSMLEAVLADRIAKVKPDRLEPENRAALLTSLTDWVAKEAREYGIEITKVRFSVFVLRARTYRLMNDQ